MSIYAQVYGFRRHVGGWTAGTFAVPARVVLTVLVALTLCGCPADDGDDDYVIPPSYDNGDDTDPNDDDSDEVANDDDNCPFRYNPDQNDADADGRGDACDNCPSIQNEDQADNDGDEAGDVCDECESDIRKTEEGVCGCGIPDIDLDGDGQPDCDGVPTFTERVIDATISEGAQLQLADLDGDGDLDIVAAIANTDTIFAYLNESNGESWTRVTVAPLLSIMVTSIALADIDGDGDLDVAALEPFDRFQGDESPGQIMWYRHPPGTQGEWEANEVTAQTLIGPRYITTGDLTGNGRPDLIFGGGFEDADGRRQGDGVFWIRNINGGQTWADPITIDDGLEGVRTVLTHDVDGDGVLDVIAAGYDDNDIMWYANSRSAGLTDLNPTFTDYTTGLTPGPYDVAIVENGFGYTADGLVLVVTDTGMGDELDTSYHTPFGDLTQSWISWNVATDFPGGTESRLCAVDFNGDGLNDVAVASLPWSDLRVYIDQGDGNWDWVSIAGGAYTGITDVKCGDIDGDGRPDLVTTSTQYFRGDRVSWWPNP